MGIQEQVKVCGQSIADWIDNSNKNDLWPSDYDTDCYFLDDQAEEFDDPFWTIEVVKDYIPYIYNSGFYGEIPLLNFWVLNKWDW